MALAGMAAREAQHALDQTNGADAPCGEGGVGPLLDRGPDAHALTDEPIDKGLLPRGAFGLAGAWRKHPGGDPGVHDHQRVHVEDAHEMRIPLHAEPLAEEDERHGVERAPHFDVPVGVDGRLAGGEDRKRGTGCRARCSTSTKCVQTWRRVVP
jgi:hypothetical protein